MDSPHDPYDVVPPDFCENWNRETIPEALAVAETAESTTDESDQPNCPWCGSIQLVAVNYTNDNPAQQKGHNYRCKKQGCRRWTNDPAGENTIFATDERAEPFDWLTLEELADADERTSLSERYDSGPGDRPAECRTHVQTA